MRVISNTNHCNIKRGQAWQVIMALAVCAIPLLAQDVITTVAGTDWVLSANGKKPTDIPLSTEVRRIAFDGVGNLYATDSLNNLVFKFGTDGVTRIVVGNGISGFSGDGGQATDASLYWPRAVAVDRAGNLYIADAFNYRIRKIDTSGVISTIAGTGIEGFSGDGGPAAQAKVGFVVCLTFDGAGNLLICDADRVRRITPGGVISTVAGNGTEGRSGDGGPAVLAQLYGPQDVQVDSLGQMYIADAGNHVLRRVSANGVISTFAGNGKEGFSGDGGPATSAMLDLPDGIALDNTGNVFFSDTNNDRIRLVSASGFISTVAGSGAQGYAGDNGPPLQASFYFPRGLAFDPSGRLLVADRGNSRIRAIRVGGTIQPVAGNGLFRNTPDGTPASRAFLYAPSGVAVDNSGNLYIADTLNYVVRKVSRNGLVQTVAGVGKNSYGPDNVTATRSGLSIPRGLAIAPNGDLIIADRGNSQIHRVGSDGIVHLIAGSAVAHPGFGGDGGPATSALLDTPSSVAVDTAGNLYIADENNDRVRKVSVNGNIITTLAGNGVHGSSGDGLQATAAALHTPTGVAVDYLGNVYISEFYGFRIRKVTPGGVISTYAGTGVYGSSGDGGPATSARLGNVYELAVDSQGNLYFSEAYTYKVRRIGTDGRITTIAGNGQAGFVGDGGPPTAASLNIPSGIAVGGDGTIFIADTNNDRIRAIQSAKVTFNLSPNQLSFNVNSRGAPSLPQTVNVSTSSPGFSFSTTVTGGSWLTVTPQSGILPAALQVSVDPSQLAAGSYTGSVAVTPFNSAPLVVSVTATVAATISGKLGASNQSLAFSLTQGAPATTSQLSISTQSGSVPFTAQSSTANGGNWLQVSPGTGTATAGAPVALTVTATAGSLAAGTYSGTIVVTSAAGTDSLTIPVTLAVAAAQQKILISQTGLTFTAVAGGGIPLPQNFGILNTGRGSMSWTASASTLGGGSNWLSIDQSSGTVLTPFTSVSPINVSVDSTGLPAGNYFGQIDVRAAGAANAPQTVAVVLNVLPPGSNPGPDVRPSGLIFIGQGGNSPGSQNVQISNPKSSAINFASGRFTASVGNWFVNLPSTAAVNPSTPAQMVVQPDYSALTPGVFQGFLTLGFLEDGVSRTVHILAVVVPPGASGAAAREDNSRDAGACSPLQVQPTVLTDVSSTVQLAQPATLQVRVVDNCGKPVTNSGGGVAASFTNGDAKIDMVHLGNGSWNGTWTPRNGDQPQVTVQFDAFSVQGTQVNAGRSSINVALRSGSTMPLSLAARNAASGVETFIAPGGLVSIYGSQFADQAAQPNGSPFPTQLNGTQVLMAGKPLPLRYVGSGQVNAQVPFGLTANTQQQLIIRRGSTISVPQDVVVAAAQPAVYTQDQKGIFGSAQGVIVNGITNALITAANPARAGDVVVIYCNGLGEVAPPVPSGAPAPSAEPLARTVNPLTVTIGGINAVVNYSGLAPGYPDLYQVNAVVPTGVAAGSAVPVVLNIAGQTSPAVTMTVQ